MCEEKFVKVYCDKELNKKITQVTQAIKESIPILKVDRSTIVRILIDWGTSSLMEDLLKFSKNEPIQMNGALHKLIDNSEIEEETK